MDFTAILLGFGVVGAIMLFLGTLNYFLGRPQSDVTISAKKSQSDTINQQQTGRLNACSMRRKQARSAKRHQRSQAASVKTENFNSNHDDDDDPDKEEEGGEAKISTSERKTEEEGSQVESSVQPTDEEQEGNEEFFDAVRDEVPVVTSSSISIEAEQEPLVPVKQRKRNKTNQNNSKPFNSSTANRRNFSPPVSTSSKHEPILSLKPQASVVPVKQTSTSTPTSSIQSNPIPQDNHSKSNGALSSTYNSYPYAGQNPLPPRFQQQQQRQRNELSPTQRLRRRKSPVPIKKSSIQPESAARHNEFVPAATRQQMNNHHHHQHQSESTVQHQTSNQNGYSSESDSLSETPSTIHTDNQNRSSTISTSTDSHHSLRGLDRSRSTTKTVDELVAVFETVSFSSEELELILNKITTKQLLNRQDWQRLLSTTSAKNDRTIERILEETYRSQAKILAIELQTEKSRVLELAKTNAEMDSTIRQLQQPNNSMLPYQQAILSYQMQMRRLTDENTRLAHQLHAYSMMPGSINELKQQQQILDEQLRHLTMRNSALEKEVADGDRASKHAAEIYKKADAQKQERIEQMIADINRYKKIDKDLTALQQKHRELEKSSKTKLKDLLHQRDELQEYCEQLREQLQDEDEVRAQYDQLMQSQTQVADLDELQRELSEVKAKNDTLRQRSRKIMEQLDRLSPKEEQTPSQAADAI